MLVQRSSALAKPVLSAKPRRLFNASAVRFGAYVEGLIAWWVGVSAVAIFASFIHELAHDLIRQWNARIAHDVMRKMGLRFNDFGPLKRANRFHLRAAATQQARAA